MYKNIISIYHIISMYVHSRAPAVNLKPSDLRLPSELAALFQFI